MEPIPTNGTVYRTLINDEPIKKERSISFEPESVKIIIYGGIDCYFAWLNRKNETVNFKLTNTDINETYVITQVILAVQLEDVVEIILKLETPQRVEERKNFFK